MKKMSIKIHTAKDSIWTNAAGDAVPLKFVPATEKRKETLAAKVHKSAIGVEAALLNFHQLIAGAFEYEIKYKKEKKGKGSFTWFSFDRSIKIEADMNEIIKWDNALMTEAKTLLDMYISSNMSEANELISGLVMGAFGNTKGMIDTGKVFQILKYQDKIKASKFQKACELIKKAQSIDKTKLYMRVWEKQEDGSYRNINLNFSAI
jgi:hypothetical protein